MLKTMMVIFARSGCIVAVMPLVALSQVGTSLGSDRGFVTCGQLLSLVPGLVGLYLRKAFYRLTLGRFSFDVHVDFGSYFSKRGSTVGKRVWIGGHTVIGYADIGQDSVIGSKVSVLSGRHQHNFSNPEKPILGGQEDFRRVRIGREVFIGEQCLVMADVGDKSIVGGGSVVVQDVPPNSVVVGNPAKIVKSRSNGS